MCGEKYNAACAPARKIGSPPRVRGKASEMPIIGGKIGITPACAGKRTPRRPRRTSDGDHPRVCGEKSSTVMSWSVMPGSPPRVRGKGLGRSPDSPAKRITPACAGKRIGETEMYVHDEDHPRVCGEKGRTIGTSRTGIGSPPRVRGKETPSRMARNCLRITPACAGKRQVLQRLCVRRWDHPRVCGEKLIISPSFPT